MNLTEPQKDLAALCVFIWTQHISSDIQMNGILISCFDSSEGNRIHVLTGVPAEQVPTAVFDLSQKMQIIPLLVGYMSESWSVIVGDGDTDIDPSEHPDRQACLQLLMETQYGERATFVWDILQSSQGLPPKLSDPIVAGPHECLWPQSMFGDLGTTLN